MERMLQYSLEHERPIRLIWQEEGKLVQRKATVTALTADTVTLRSLRPRGETTITRESILSADFVKGDEGQG